MTALAPRQRETAEVAEAAICDEAWIGSVEPCAGGWMFCVIGSDEEMETFVYGSAHAAECARAEMFRIRWPAVSIVCAP